LNGNIIQEQKVQLQVNKQQLDDKLSQEEKRNTNSTLNIIEEQSLQLGMNPIRNAFAEKKQSALKGFIMNRLYFNLFGMA